MMELNRSEGTGCFLSDLELGDYFEFRGAVYVYLKGFAVESWEARKLGCISYADSPYFITDAPLSEFRKDVMVHKVQIERIDYKRV